jgi:hypothetical protein
MNRVKLSIIATMIACLMVGEKSSAQVEQALPVTNPTNDTARFLAGMMPLADPMLKEMTLDESWKRHTNFFNTAWADLDKRQLSKIRAWTGTHAPAAFSSKSTLFYMFSGPDFLYASTFFPQATTYVLCGIEPIGPIPDVSNLPRNLLGGELRSLQSSLNSVLSFSFFRTIDMKEDFKNHALSGTLPVLYIFLARSGMTINEVSYVSVDQSGALGPQPDPVNPNSKAPGVRISFVANGSDVKQTLYYFSTDISNDGIKKSGFLPFCKTLAAGNSFVKSASYLMHETYFSSIREFLLSNTETLIQDDSGIPCSFFTQEKWDMTFHGSYPGPITLFKNYGQPLLYDYYKTTKPAPLDFGIGYRHRAKESTLMVMNRKSGALAEPKLEPIKAKSPLRALPVPEEDALPSTP